MAHRKEQVEALAQRVTRGKLKAPEKIGTWQTVRVVDIRLGDGRLKRSVTQGSAPAAKVLTAVGINKPDPDTDKASNRAA